MVATFFTSVIAIMAIFLFGCVGEILTEKSGHLNLGTPGIMCTGAAGAALGAKVFIDISGGPVDVAAGLGNPFLGVLFPLLFCLLLSGLAGLLYCFLVDTLRCNQNVTGLVLTTFGAGLFQFLGMIVCPSEDRGAFTHIGRTYFGSIFPESFINANDFTRTIFSHGFLVYLIVAIAIASFFIIKKTRIGLNLRAVGENPGTSDASGINVIRYKYLATLIGSLISGLGGLYYLFGYNCGSMEFNLESFGWIAVALVIFSIWNTGLAVLGSFIFATLYQLPIRLNVNGSLTYIVSLLPYFFTIFMLITISIFNKKETQPPSALGLTYFREDR